ncbi:transcription elongation factor GreB [Hymenobacter luteus]|uniref:Transcription elongation factor GreB n=2 Tax=Hymenobacter TaxID=89966 RepID=A0A7W9T232_9BACT|nr:MULTISPECIES: GreA/GreB family elongation factor [Hymenobacter]MBB4603202.1 transcription elongation factor GreB [Hymenobacter latericoloratus]MBB6060100.1 transcription elongation factor GreB [Hymenobacter luteus]
MSRAFTKEDDSLEAPIIPPRPALPPGTPNYVTPEGLEQLRQELVALEAERTLAEANRENEADRTRRLTVLNGQLSALNARIASAKVVDPRSQPPQEVRFGATVTLRPAAGVGAERSFTIVGVDEASVAAGKVAFVAPIARAVQGARLGQRVQVRLGAKIEELEVAAIQYGEG